jgi:precorrin-4/cobalt-precorrin-4 C11-methyltransferase
MAFLDKMGIEYEVVPGISSLFAAAASLKTELTVPEVSQTVIITRMKGRTDVPEAENLKSLAAHGSTIAVFLSTSLANEVVDALVQGGYHPDTPAALVYKASWQDERVTRAALKDLPDEIKKAGIKKQALILVGRFLNLSAEETRSKLYDKSFKHEYRK